MVLKRGLGIILVVLFLFSINLVFAQEDPIEKSYQCFENSLGDNCGGTNNVEQLAFNLLAISYDSNLQSDCKSALNSKRSGVCWGSTGAAACNVRNTAISVLSLNKIEEDVTNALDWLKGKTQQENELTWFLQIDANNKTECTINNQKITIQTDKKVTGSNPAGLVKAFGNYWFEIKDTNKNYSISCDRDFISTLLYQKRGSSVYYISDDTHSAPAHDSTNEKVESFCFTNGGICDYDASLWASLALAEAGEPINRYIPYITAMADEPQNKKFIPSSFLYILTREDDYYSELISLQKNGRFWDESGRRSYDTSIALLALQNVGLEEVDSAKRYLLSIAESSGCWAEYTSLILYSGWPRIPSISGGGVGGPADCEAFNNFCVQIGDCDSIDTLSNFYCPGLSEVCCAVVEAEPTCIEREGIICDSVDEECSGNEVSTADTNYCCLGSCEEIEVENECDASGFFCRDSCSKDQEEQIAYSSSCGLGNVCCRQKPKEEGNFLLIILLIILIILVIVAIIFRNQLKVWLFKRKVGKGRGPPTAGRPGPPGFPPLGPTRPRRVIPRRRVSIRRPSIRPEKKAGGKEFDETMKKLREMSK